MFFLMLFLSFGNIWFKSGLQMGERHQKFHFRWQNHAMPLFMLGICYLKNMQAILLKTSKLMKTRKKNQKTVLQVKATFRFGISQSPYSTALIMNFVPWVEVSNIAFFHLSVSWRACPSLRIPASKSGTHQDLEQANIESVFSTGILKLQNSRFRAEKLHGFFELLPRRKSSSVSKSKTWEAAREKDREESRLAGGRGGGVKSHKMVCPSVDGW